MLLWLYLLALAVLIGAAVNASFDTEFPQKATTSARLELVQRLRSRMAREAHDAEPRTGKTRATVATRRPGRRDPRD